MITSHVEAGEPAKAKWCNGCKSEKPVEGFWKNQTRCKECQQAWRRGTSPHASGYAAWKHGLRTKFGIAPEDYYRMYEEQGGVCAICSKAEPERRLAVDHCHRTGKVRGLLCRKCNMAVGLLGEDPDVLTRARSYLAAQDG